LVDSIALPTADTDLSSRTGAARFFAMRKSEETLDRYHDCLAENDFAASFDLASRDIYFDIFALDESSKGIYRGEAALISLMMNE
jgi:hypothetical protein